MGEFGTAQRPRCPVGPARGLLAVAGRCYPSPDSGRASPVRQAPKASRRHVSGDCLLRKLAAAVLAVPVVALLYVPVVTRRSIAARLAISLGIGSVIGLAAI